VSKLRDLLNAQKKEQANGIAKPVLQSEPEKTAVKVEAASAQEKSLPDAIVNGQAIDYKITGNSVVEQGPPPGLSFLQRKQWEAKNGKSAGKNEAKATVSDNLVNSSSGSGTNETGKGILLPTPGNNVAAKSNGSVPPAQTTQQEQTQVAEKSAGNNATDGKIDVETLRTNLVYLANNIEQPEMVGQVVKKIAMQLKQSPELVPFMKDADFDLIVRGARSAYKIAARKKAEQRDSKAKGKKDNSALEAEFKAAGLDQLLGTLKL